MATVESDATVTIAAGSITDKKIADGANIKRAKMAQRVAAVLSIPLTAWRVFDALATPLPATSASDDMGLYGGVAGTDLPYIGTGDVKSAGAVVRKARAIITLPEDYEAGETVGLRFLAKMASAIADGLATLDVEAFAINADGTLSTDLYAGAAADINDTTADTYDFDLTAGSLVPGQQIDVRLTLSVTDTATAAGTVIAKIFRTALLADLR